MKAVVAVLLLALPMTQANPIAKVISMLGNLEAKIIGEGEAAQKVYTEFAEYCEDTSKDLGFDIKTGKSNVAELTATIDQETSDISALESKIEDLSAEIAKDEADLKAATEIRAKESADFKTEEADLVETIDMLERAIVILERGSSLLQSKGAASLADALKVLVAASGFSSADTKRLTSLVQSSSASDDSDMGAPDPEAYKSHSGDIISTLEGLLEKAKDTLADSRRTEQNSLNNFELMEQTLQDEIKFGGKEMSEAKTKKAQCAESKATAEGDLDVTSKSLAESEKSLADLHSDCMARAEDFEAETKSRAEELRALAEAKKVIKEATAGAEDIVYTQEGTSLLQQNSLQLKTGTDLAGFEAVRFVRDLARKQKSPALAQLAQRMSSMMRFGTGDDIFAKVKDLIRDLIDRLLKEGAADASHKAYCDKELAESNAKKDDLTAEVAKLTSKIDSMSSRSAGLKDQVADLQKQLAELARTQAEMDKIRGEEKAVFNSAKAELEEGLEGLKMALKILKEYYASEGKSHEAAEGAGGGIIGLLEVVESDFSKELAEISSTEETAAAEYERETKENEIRKATMEQDVKYKSKEAAELDTGVAEASSDREGTNTELAAVNEYLKKLEGMCIAKPESYAERVARRDAEIAGLKQALEILAGDSVLLQRAAKMRFRGRRSA